MHRFMYVHEHFVIFERRLNGIVSGDISILLKLNASLISQYDLIRINSSLIVNTISSMIKCIFAFLTYIIMGETW